MPHCTSHVRIPAIATSTAMVLDGGSNQLNMTGWHSIIHEQCRRFQLLAGWRNKPIIGKNTEL
jgi:hypothetical protein